MDAKIFYCKISNLNRADFFDAMLQKLPPIIQDRILQYRLDKDRFLRTTGKALLYYALQKMGLDPDTCLSDYRYNENNKPSFGSSNIHFSLSYSGHIAICAVTNNENIGIDIEEIRPIEPILIDSFFDVKSRLRIRNACDPIAEFYQHWTILEAALKTAGIPISQLELLETQISDKEVILEGKHFYYACPVIEPGYKFCIASRKRRVNVELIKVPIECLC